jgi:alanine-synthesizing transaminase
MSESATPRRFSRIDRLPPYVFNITAELKMAARRRGEDIVDMSMGNPDGATPQHIVDKLVEVSQRPDTHGYSASKGIPRLRRAISHWYKNAMTSNSTRIPKRSSPSVPRKGWRT